MSGGWYDVLCDCDKSVIIVCDGRSDVEQGQTFGGRGRGQFSESIHNLCIPHQPLNS